MTVNIDKNSIRSEVQSKLPNEDEVMEYFQAQRMSGQAKKAYESYISQKYEDDTTDSLGSITDKLDNSDLAPTELRNMYGSISKKVSEGIPKVLNTLEDELNRRIKEPVNIRNLSDLKEFCSKSKSNHRAIKESLLSAVERIGSGGSKVVSAIKTILKTLSYGVLKTVQAVSAVFMLSFLAWPAMVAGWPIKGTAIIISAIIGLIGPAMIAQRVDDRMFKGLL